MKIEELYKLYTSHYLVDTDTRKIRKNTIFFALKGVNFNGNKFAEEALRKGAIYSVVDEAKYISNDRIILVDNVLKTLQELASFHRKQLNIPIVALTGSNGKTTTKELINAVLSKKYTTIATIGNLNNHIGVPLTLLSMTPNTEIGIVEMGANHKKEISFLCDIAEPNYGYITNFGKAHLEGFGSVEGVIEGKSELYHFLLSVNETVFVNQSDAIQLKKTESLNRVFFDDSINLIEVNPFIKLQYKQVKIQTQLIGIYNFSNISAAISIGQYFNVKKEDIVTAIENYVPNNNRSQIIKTKDNRVVLDAYNANPTSMKVALENFNMISAQNKMVILGDMFELGKNSAKEHQQIVDLVLSYNFDKIFFIGEHFYQTEIGYNKFKTFEAFKTDFKSDSITDYTILIKGSRGMALERVLDEIS